MTQPPTNNSESLMRFVVLAVAVWGGLLACGAFLFGYDETTGSVQLSPNPWRGLITLACVATFVGTWVLLLRRRSA